MVEKIVIYCVVGLTILGVLFFAVSQWSDHLKFKRNEIWKEQHAEKVKAQKQKEKEKKLEKLSWVYPGNPIVEMMTSECNIEVDGHKGAGKDLSCNMFAKYWCDKYETEDRKNKGFNKYLRPNYLKELKRLEDNKELRVATMNVEYNGQNGFKSGDLWQYITQKKKIVPNHVFVWSEIGKDGGKKLYYNTELKNTNEIRMIDDFFRLGRKYKAKIFVNEQSGNNIYIEWRNTGFAKITALKTYKPMSKWGKCVRKLYFFSNAILPAWFTLKWQDIINKQLFAKDKWLTALKMLLPARFFLPRDYYINKIKINRATQLKYQWFKVRYDYYGQEILLQFRHNQIFNYDTDWGKKDYDKRFNEEGDALWMN